ncbi:hypothetical protein [Croceitalea sp. MTPC5]|uniref:hypothetical protein n=1 Tax=Croceitalea sp. MTPC5 TaxID=3056565 RepID=UPI0030CEB885
MLTNSFLFGQNQLNLDYHQSINNKIDFDYDTKSYYIDDILSNKIEPKEVYKIVITNKQEMSYFLKNIHQFSNLLKLHIYKTKLLEFDFLNSLKNLRVLSLSHIRKIDYDGLVDELNKISNIKHLIISSKSLRRLPKKINKLNYLKSLGIKNSKIKHADFSISLYYLELTSNRKIDFSSINIENTEVVYLKNNGIKDFPKNLGSSKTLRSLIISQPEKFNFDCFIKGFINLEILDIFSTPVLGIKNSCFIENKNIEIVQQER